MSLEPTKKNFDMKAIIGTMKNSKKLRLLFILAINIILKNNLINIRYA
jgi:hypothetical protein